MRSGPRALRRRSGPEWKADAVVRYGGRLRTTRRGFKCGFSRGGVAAVVVVVKRMTSATWEI